MNSENKKGFREGAMMVALTAVFLLVVKYIPFLSTFGTVICCLPLSLLAVRNNFKVLSLSVFATFLITFLVEGNVISAVSMLFMSYLPGIIAGYMLGRKKPFFFSLFSVAVAISVGWIFELLMIEFLMNGGISKLLSETLSGTRAVMIEMINNLDVNREALGNLSPEEFVSNIITSTEIIIRTYFPSFVVISAMVVGYLILRVTGFFAKRTLLLNIYLPPFSSILAPRSMCNAAVIFYLVYIFIDPQSRLWPVFGNLIFILYTIIGISGLSFIDFKLKAKIKSGVLRFLIYVFVFFLGQMIMSIITSVLIIIGILDSSRNFRQIENKTENL